MVKKDMKVFRNSGQSGAVDLIALNVNSGELLLVDVKSYKDGRLSLRTSIQKSLVLDTYIITLIQRR